MLHRCCPLRTAAALVLALVALPAPEAAGVRRAPLPKARPKRFQNAAGMTMVPVPGTRERFPITGTFTRGSPKGEKGRNPDEAPQHEVEVSAFYLSAHEVTLGQFRAFVRDAGHRTEAERARDRETWQSPGFDQGDDHPVTCVSWDDAKAFVTWLNRRPDGKRPTGWVYRLPREAEWEYACRAGAPAYQTFHFGDVLDDSDPKTGQANFDGHDPYGSGRLSGYHRKTRPVGSYPANAFGLFDMHGNVWEWCADRHDPAYYAKCRGAVDPAGPAAGTDRVLRGGAWDLGGRDCRSAVRLGCRPTHYSSNIGFRVALVPSGRGEMR